MNCPEHLVAKLAGGRVYLWMYWRDVRRETIPLRVWINPLRYELVLRVAGRVIVVNREGRMARRAQNAWATIRRATP